VEINSLPTELEIVEPARPEIQVTVRGLRKDASTLKPRDIRVRLALANAVAGTQSFRIFQNLIPLPGSQLDVVRIQPVEHTLTFEPKAASAGKRVRRRRKPSCQQNSEASVICPCQRDFSPGVRPLKPPQKNHIGSLHHTHQRRMT
jgi:hypothetical protein